MQDKPGATSHLLNVFHHNSLDLGNLSFHFGKFTDLFRVIHTILHVLLQFRPIEKTKLLIVAVKGNNKNKFLINCKNINTQTLF